MYNLFEPTLGEEHVLTFIKVYDSSKEQRIETVEVMTLEESTQIKKLKKRLTNEKRITEKCQNLVLREKMSSLATMQLSSYQMVSAVKTTDKLSDVLASSDRPLAILIFLEKTEETEDEEKKEEVNKYLREIVSTIEVSVHEYPSREWKASIRFQKHHSFDYVAEQVAKVLQEKEEEKKLDKNYLQFYTTRDKATTRGEEEDQLFRFQKKGSSTIESMLTCSNRLYYNISGLSAEEHEQKY